MKLLKRYYHTIRHLQMKQVIWRGYYLIKPRPPLPKTSLSLRDSQTKAIVPFLKKNDRIIDNDTALLLNKAHDISSWQDSKTPLLNLYHLHYFHFLFHPDANPVLNETLIARWVNENTPGKGIGWDPYPLSLRIVNWIKWHLNL